MAFKGNEIQARLRATVNADDRNGWDILWKEKVTPWDAGLIQPSLIEVIEESGIDFPRTGRALVPGCGTGYDVLYLSSRGLQALGMDISETAVETANRYRDENSNPNVKKASFMEADFFKVVVPDDERFDLVVDHTFFCAIPPSQRSEWGRRMAELIKLGGYLITSVYPMNPKEDIGPPYYLRPEHYDEPLSGAFKKIYDKVPTKSSASHEGKERMLVWRRQ